MKSGFVNQADLSSYDAYYNRLESAKNLETGERTTYEYYVDVLRKSKDGTYYIWLDGNMVYEFTSSSSKTYTYGHRLLYSDDVKYVLNAHGDVVALINASGAVTKRYEYDAFGNELNPTSNDVNPFRYCAEYLDLETGQVYLRNRYYQPKVGRFSQRDAYWNTANMIYGDEIKIKEYRDYLGLNTYTIKLINYAAVRQSGNLYGYCLNDPEFFVDIIGESASAVFIGAWEVGGGLAISDGIFPFGDFAGIVIGAGGTIVAGGMAIGSWWKNLTNAKSNEVVVEKETTIAPKQENPVYYHITSRANAEAIVTTGIINSGEGGYVYAWKMVPSKDVISQSGARYIGSDAVMIRFQSSAAFSLDTTVNPEALKYGPVHTVFKGNISIQNSLIIPIS